MTSVKVVIAFLIFDNWHLIKLCFSKTTIFDFLYD